jgi:flagellar motor protein MotB
MGKKILMTEKQLKMVRESKRKKCVLVSEAQLKKIVAHINEGQEEILEEGVKDIILGAILTAASVLNVNAQDVNVVRNDNVQKTAAKELSKGDSGKEAQILNQIQNNEELFAKEFKKKLGQVDKDMTVHGDSQKDVARVLAQLKHGYAIKGVHKDTIVHEVAPETFEVKVDSVVTPNSGNMFKSGGFELEDSFKSEIINQIKEHGGGNKLIVGITIQSSTDKEQVSSELGAKLSGMGLSPDNQGLSTARNTALKRYLVDTLGIDANIIEQDILANQGQGEQDPNARYVKTFIFFVDVAQAPSEPTEEITINTVFELSKPVGKGSPIKGGTKAKCYKGQCPNPMKTRNTPKGSQLGTKR